MTEQQIADNFEKVRTEIAEAEQKSGRAAGSVRLCAVSKFHPAQDVIAAMHAGQALFGENRVQEAYDKFGLVREAVQTQPQLHIIGSLQTNKVKKAVSISSCIQSVDREPLLAEIERQCARIGKTIEIFFEIHTGEDTKSGYTDTDELFASAEHCASGMYPHIVPRGLMTMAPFTREEKPVREAFSSVRKLKEELGVRFPSLRIQELSMGMSQDFAIAVEEGSTMVRIGTALFGERPAAL